MFASFLAISLALSAPAVAQREVQSAKANPSDRMASVSAKTLPSTDLAIEAMHNFSRCVVDRGARGPAALLAMDYRTAEHKQALRRLARGHDYCARGRIKFNGLLFTGGLAERLITRSLQRDAFVAAVAFDPSRPTLEARDTLEMIGLCTVRRSPMETMAIFDTEPATDAEDRAMKAAGPALVACVPAGQKATLNRPGLRAILALAAYRLIHNNRPGVMPGAGS